MTRETCNCGHDIGWHHKQGGYNGWAFGCQRRRLGLFRCKCRKFRERRNQ